MDDELRFQDFLEDDNQAPTLQEDDVQPEAHEPVESPGEAGEPEEQVAPSAEERVTFEDYLRNNGFEISDDVAPEDFYAQAAAKLTAGTQAIAEVERLRAELEKAKQAPVPAAPYTPPAEQPQPEQPPVETPAEQKARLFKELPDYDRNLLNYVEMDDLGRAIPKAEYGPRAIEAAEKINAHEQDVQRQAKLLLSNPNLLIQENLSEIERLAEERAKKIVDERFSKWQEEQTAAEKEREAAQQQTLQEQRLSKWHEENKSKLLKLAPNGEPAIDPFDSSYVYTPMGKVFLENLNKLRSRMPGADQLALMDTALEMSQVANVQPAAQQPVKTQAEQRKKFSQQPIPNQNLQPAPVEEVAESRPTLRFSDMVRQDPENQDIIAGW